ncbi:MAG: DUF4349 domain-containing protein [Chitinophagaceae bacterium]
MKINILLSSFLLTAILISCDTKQKSNTGDTMSTTIDNVPDAKVISQENKKILSIDQQVPVADTVSKTVVLKNEPGTGSIDWDKKIIKTASLKLEVKNFKSYSDNLHKTVKQFGGYIANEENSSAEDRSETVMSIKVPVAQFEDLMNQLPAADSKIMERKISTEDVTGEMVDTQSRLEAKKQMRLKYLEFLKQSKNMEEVLQVQTEINNIQEAIESAAGRVGYLSHQSAYSTINLSFYEPLPGFKVVEPEHPSFLGKLTHAFTSGASWIADLFVALVSIWPVWLIIAIVLLLIKKMRPGKIILPNP